MTRVTHHSHCRTVPTSKTGGEVVSLAYTKNFGEGCQQILDWRYIHLIVLIFMLYYRFNSIIIPTGVDRMCAYFDIVSVYSQ